VAEETYIGWEIGLFGVECLHPDDKETLTSIQVWLAYRQWCSERGDDALAEAKFAERFDELAREVGIMPRQVGGNLSYLGVALNTGDANDVDGRKAA
jgi:hypothetical protein